MTFRYEIFLKVSNLLSYIVTLGVILYYEINVHHSPSDGSDFKGNGTNYTDSSITYITPANYTFHIWGLIHILLGGFVIYQWFESAEETTIKGVKYYFSLVNIGCVSWIVLWHMDYRMLDCFVAVCSSLALILIYVNLEHYPAKSIYDRLFIHYAFTIYSSWAIFATTLTFWVAFEAIDTVFLSTIIVAVFGLVGVSFVDYTKRKDIVFAGTLAWSLIGVAIRQYKSLPILIAASVSSGLIVGGIFRVLIHQIVTWWHLRTHSQSNVERAERGERTGTERTPLLQNNSR